MPVKCFHTEAWALFAGMARFYEGIPIAQL